MNASIATEVMTSTAGQVAESMTTTANQVKKSISEKAAQVSTTLTDILLEGFDTEDEFEAFKTSELAEFRGVQGLENFEVLQEDTGILVNLQDFYFYMLNSTMSKLQTLLKKTFKHPNKFVSTTKLNNCMEGFLY